MSIGQLVLLIVLAVLIGVAFRFRAKLAEWLERLRVFYREVSAEMRKVTWPAKQEVVGNTIVVLTAVIILAAMIGVMDGILAWIVKAMFS